MHLKEMSKLNQYINASVKHHRLQRLHETILGVYEDLNAIFFGHVMEYSKYIEGQIISLAVTLFRLQYGFRRDNARTEPCTRSRSSDQAFRKYAPFRVFHDMVETSGPAVATTNSTRSDPHRSKTTAISEI